MKITRSQLRRLIREALGKKKPLGSPYKAALARLAKMGYRISDRETTPGAYKTWLDAPRGVINDDDSDDAWEKLVKAFPNGQSIGSAARGEEELLFSWGYITPYGSHAWGIFVLAYRKGAAGEEGRMGIDT